jgi:mannitol/fructose-specific phosphotransferase system IIA component (Ntr-type)
VTKLAQNGAIPAVKVARQWRFERAAINQWLASRPSPAVTQQPLPSEATGFPELPGLTDVLKPNRIKLDLTARDKDGILRELVALVIDPREKRLTQTLYKALKAREDLCSTCVDDGVAIPHSRNAIVGLVDQPVLAYGRHRTGLDFGALDGRPVQHFFLLCAPNVREHLQLLARLARLVKSAEFRAKLAAAAQPAEVIELIRQAEQSVK